MKPTEKQLEYIMAIYENCPYPIPAFSGKTKEEASEYIDKYKKMAHEDEWAIEHGYG